MAGMRTVILGDHPPEIEDWFRLRRERGQDRFDEVWEGAHHVAPAPSWSHASIDHQLARILGDLAERASLHGAGRCNIGTPDDYRVPDQAYFRRPGGPMWSATAAIVVEILAPDDETWDKLPFYHRAGVEELVIADPGSRTIRILVREALDYRDAGTSAILGVDGTSLASAVHWPD